MCAGEDYAIYVASEEGYLEIVKYLIEQGANIHAKDDAALRLDFQKGYSDVVEYLNEMKIQPATMCSRFFSYQKYQLF